MDKYSQKVKESIINPCCSSSLLEREIFESSPLHGSTRIKWHKQSSHYATPTKPDFMFAKESISLHKKLGTRRQNTRARKSDDDYTKETVFSVPPRIAGFRCLPISKFYGLLIILLSTLWRSVEANLWSETARMSDLQQWRYLCGRYQVAQAYMEDSNARITVFAPVNDVFLYNPDLRAMDQKETLSHIIDTQVVEVSQGRKWEKQTLIRSTINSGYVYITQFENNPGNFSYFVNAGTICNHVSNQWGVITGEQYLYKTCTPMGHRPYPGTALSFIRDDDNTIFVDRQYDNRDLTELRDILNRVPDIALVIYGSSAWNGFHTFFLPSNKAFAKVIDRNRIDREVLLVHVTGMNRVLFTWPWLYDGGSHYYPTIRFSSNIIEDNFKIKIIMRNITDHRTGRWDLYAVSEIYERYSQFRRGAIWAKILVPNIPVQNGVVHIVDNVLGIVSNTIDQLLMDNYRCTTLMRYINTIGQIVRAYFSATGGLVTFFAPWNEAFERIPEPIERRLLRDRIWLEQVLKLHIVPAKELTTDEITNETIVATVDNMRHLYFIRGEWPKNNITYYVIGGGIKTAIQMDNVAGVNGIVHYIDRVLGVPYQSLWEILRNETKLQRSFDMLQNLQLRYSLDPWQVMTPEQNFTFFVPTNEAWDKVSPSLKNRILDGNHWHALQYVYKRHLLQGQALMYTDLRERTYIMMNDEKVIIRRRGRYFELYWPRGNRVARVIEGGEIAGINGFMHMIDNVLIYEPDLRAVASTTLVSDQLVFIALIFTILAGRRR
ncbi:fasciclin domain-containing protein [Ditylenchus destructor]|uniref:Fasciclin domain-containing protein n=1 Tax=Ditylenchus destructor TaxID=166010 RepID=A0AAD4R924_9BILA|nr:fasciclin domain-containing protein [Ditylenchus destructor]